MTFRVRVLGVYGGGDHFNRVDKELAVLLRGQLQIADVVLDVLGHQVKGSGEFANFRAAADLRPLREVALGDGPSRLGQQIDGVGNGGGREKADQQTEDDQQQAP